MAGLCGSRVAEARRIQPLGAASSAGRAPRSQRDPNAIRTPINKARSNGANDIRRHPATGRDTQRRSVHPKTWHQTLAPTKELVIWFLTQMYARFSLRQVGHRSGKTPRMCSCSIRSGAVVCRSVDGRLRGPLSWWGPARRQPDQTQAADSMSLTWRRTVKASRTRPRLSPTFYAGAEPSLTVQPPWNWQPHHDSAVCCGRTFREPATPLQIRTVFFSHVSH